MGARPELDKAEDLLGLFALAEIRIGVAEGVAVGILRQEGEHTLLPPAAHRHVVALDDGMLPMVGDGVKVEIKDRPGQRRAAPPGACQAAKSAVVMV